MPSRFLGLAVQSDVRCASGVPLAFLSAEDLVACAAVLSPTEPESLTFTVARDDERVATIFAGRVVRTVFVGGTDDREWDVTQVTDTDGDGRVSVTAQPIALRLSRVIYAAANATTGVPEMGFDDADALVTAVIDDRILPAAAAAGLTWIARGTVDFTGTVSISGEWVTLLEIIVALCASERAGAEWQLRRNGDTDYRLDLLTSIGSSAATVPVRTRVNLLQNRRTREMIDLATRLVGKGASEGYELTMAAHLWRVASVVSGTVLELEDIQGGDGPIAYDDQLNGLYVAVLNDPTFASQAVSDSVAATQRITVASTAGITAGEWVRFFEGSGENGDRVISLANPTAALSPASGGQGDRAQVLDRPGIRADCNLVPNPWMREYASSGDAPDDWTDTIGTPANGSIARESTIVREGTPYSARLETTGTTTFALDTPAAYPWAISGRRHFAAIWFNLQAVPAATDSAILFELVTDGGTLITELGRWVRGSNTPDLDTWTRFVPNVVDLSAITTPVKLRIKLGTATTSDAASGWDVVIGPALLAEAEVPVLDIEYSGGTTLWQSVNRELPIRSLITRGYDLQVLDLQRDDADTYSSLAFTPGGLIEVTDVDLGETATLRLLEYRPDYLNPLRSQLRVGQKPRDVGSEIVGPPTPITPGANTGPWLDIVETPGASTYEYSWAGGPGLVSVRVVLSESPFLALYAAPPDTNPFVVKRPASTATVPFRVIFRTVGPNGDATSREFSVPPVATLPPSIPSLSVTRDSGTQFTVEWTVANMPSGVTYRIVWQVTADGSGSGTVNNATTPEAIAATLGSAPEGDVTLEVYASDGTFLLSRLASGPFFL